MESIETAMVLRVLADGIPVLVLGFLVFQVILRYTKSKQDDDRREHMAKWDSMVKLQADAITIQTASMNRIIEAHKKEIDRIIDSHNEETERHGRLFERQAAALESLTVELTRVTSKLNEKSFCPRSGEEDGK